MGSESAIRSTGTASVEAPMLDALSDQALAAMERAYAPYSRFRVGAALLGTDGSITVGVNVENAAYPSGICAERGAIGGAVANGVRSFRALVIATEADEPTPPCGMCRQVLQEFAPQLLIVSVTRAGARAQWTLDELFPRAFTPHSLDRR